MRFWFDTEFIEDGRTIELLSIGIVAADGRTYYAENRDADLSRANLFVAQHVIPHLNAEPWQRRRRDQIAREIVEFAGEAPEWWAYFADYDWVVLCQLFGRMIDLPEGWPMMCLDVQQLAHHLRDFRVQPPKMAGIAHNALDDAIWCMQYFEALRDAQQAQHTGQERV